MAPLRTSSLKAAAHACAALLLAITLASALTACGKRGDPEPPPDEKDKFPQTYPDPKSYPDYRTYPPAKTN